MAFFSTRSPPVSPRAGTELPREPLGSPEKRKSQVPSGTGTEKEGLSVKDGPRAARFGRGAGAGCGQRGELSTSHDGPAHGNYCPLATPVPAGHQPEEGVR